MTDSTAPDTEPERRSRFAWIAIAGVLVVLTGLGVGAYFGYRAYAVRQFVSAASDGRQTDVLLWARRLRSVGALQHGLRVVFEESDGAGAVGVLSDHVSGTVEHVAGLLDPEESTAVRRNAIRSLHGLLAMGEMQIVGAFPNTVHAPSVKLAEAEIARAASEDVDLEVRSQALWVLACLAVDAPVHPVVIDALRDESPRIRYAAVSALGFLRPDPSIVPVLFELIDSGDSEVAVEAVQLLAMIDWDARPAMDRLEALLEHSDPRVAEQMARGLPWMTFPLNKQPSALPLEWVLARYRRLLVESDTVPSYVFEALEDLGENAKPLWPDLLPFLENESLRADVSRALRKIDRVAAEDAGVDFPIRDDALIPDDTKTLNRSASSARNSAGGVVRSK